MFRLTIESSSGPYIKVHTLIHSKCVMGSQTLTYYKILLKAVFLLKKQLLEEFCTLPM